MHLLNGRALAEVLFTDLKRLVEDLRRRDLVPALHVISVGTHEPSRVYIGIKERMCRKAGLDFKAHAFDEKVDEEFLCDYIESLNADSRAHGIIVQLPLPSHINVDRIIGGIDPRKDVDGLHTHSLGALFKSLPGFAPPTANAAKILTKMAYMDLSAPLSSLKDLSLSLKGLHAVVIGRSFLVGRPLSMLLLQKDATVSIAHSKTRGLKDLTRSADIVISAIGVPHFIDASYVSPGSVVIDVGINRLEGGGLCGDVLFKEVASTARAITPVPGGVGPLTVYYLIENTVKAATLQE